MPRQKTKITLTEAFVHAGRNCLKEVLDANGRPQEFESLGAAMTWIRTNVTNATTIYPIRVLAPVKISVETVRRVEVVDDSALPQD